MCLAAASVVSKQLKEGNVLLGELRFYPYAVYYVFTASELHVHNKGRSMHIADSVLNSPHLWAAWPKCCSLSPGADAQ